MSGEGREAHDGDLQRGADFTGMLDKPPTGNLDAVEIRLDETPAAAEAPASGASGPGAGDAPPAEAPDPADYFKKK